MFAAALVATACVAAAGNWPLALGLGVACGCLGAWVSGWKTGVAWFACAWISIGVFTWRTETRLTDERELLEFSGGEMRGHLLTDASGSERFWSAPVILENGPRPGARVWWEGRGELPVAGSRVEASGSFGPLPEPRNPGDFNHAAWLRSQSVAVVFHASWIPGKVATGRWASLGAGLRSGFRKAVTDGLEENSRQAMVIRAVVIGEKPPEAEELLAAYRNSGTLHAFSVSGLHVAMVGSICWLLLRLAGVRRRPAIVLLLPLIFGYSWLTGNSPPAMRSAWMAAVFLLAFVFRRKPDLLNALGAVLLAAALWDGRLLFLPGVQLSYGVVAAIAIGAGFATRWFAWMGKPELYLPLGEMNRWQTGWLHIRRKMMNSLGVSVAAGIGSAPLTAFHFGLVTPVSVLAGVFMVPVIFGLLGAALISAAIHPFVPSAARVVNRLNGLAAETCTFMAEGFAALPGGHFKVRADQRPFLLIYDLEHGAGSACFVGESGTAVLLDCADPHGFKWRVAASLRRLGVTPDAVVLSHPDGDHLGGGAEVWETFPIRQVLLPVEKSRSPAFRSWLHNAPQAGVKTLQVAALKSLPMPDGASLEILHVPDPISQNTIADDRVAIFRLHWRGWKLLFMSDAGEKTERAMREAGHDLAADVIIAGRHRDDEFLTDKFLAAVNPQMIVAGHSDFPLAERLNPQAVDYWRSLGIRVLHQGETGGVTFRVDEAGQLCVEGFADRSVTILKVR